MARSCAVLSEQASAAALDTSDITAIPPAAIQSTGNYKGLGIN